MFWVTQILGLYGGFWVTIVFGELGSLPILWVLCNIDSHEFGGFVVWYGLFGIWLVGFGCCWVLEGRFGLLGLPFWIVVWLIVCVDLVGVLV